MLFHVGQLVKQSKQVNNHKLSPGPSGSRGDSVGTGGEVREDFLEEGACKREIRRRS